MTADDEGKEWLDVSVIVTVFTVQHRTDSGTVKVTDCLLTRVDLILNRH